MSENFDINNLMQKAKEMQEQMQTAQQQIASIKVVGKAGNGLVEVTMNGAHYVEKVKISPTLLNDDEEDMVEDLVAAAINDAVKKIEEGTKTKMLDIAKNFKMPAEFEDMMRGGGDN